MGFVLLTQEMTPLKAKADGRVTLNNYWGLVDERTRRALEGDDLGGGRIIQLFGSD